MAHSRRSIVIAGLLVAACLVGGLVIWKGGGTEGPGLGGRSNKHRDPSLFAGDNEVDRDQPAGGIEGVVRDAEGRPLDGASVILVRIPAKDAPPSPSNGRPVGTTGTAGGGRFTFADLAPGTYAVSAMALRHAPGRQSPVEVVSRKTATVEVKLGKGGFLLQGRVLDLSGGTVPRAKVTAREISMGPEDASAGPRVWQATADDAGNYQLFLGRAQYSLLAEADGYAPGGDFFMLTADASRDLRLSPASGIGGRVVERGTGKPVPGAELWVAISGYGGMYGRPRDVKSDEEGRFWFNDLEPGSYRIGARKGRLVGMSTTVSVALTQRVDDVQVEINPGFVVAGRAVDRDGKPVGGVRVDLWKSSPPRDRPLFARSEPDGAFRIEGVLPAEFQLGVRSDGFAPSRQELKVAGDVTNLVVKLVAEASVAGRVIGADGAPVEGAKVSALVRTRGSGGAMEAATTGSDGSFHVKSLGAGDLTLSATHERGVAVLKDEKLADGETRQVTLRLAPGGTISGTVKLDDGRPAAGARIQAQSWDGGAGRWSETAGSDGSYRLTGITAGKVIIVATTGPGWRWGGPDRPDQKTVTMAEAENKTGVDLVVAGAHSISGTVVDPQGQPVIGAEVTANLQETDGPAFRRPGMGMGQRAFTQSDGSFTLEGLGAGKHSVWAVHAGYADAEAKGVDGGATGVRLQFPPEATIAGVVSDPQGKPVSDYTISLAPGPKPGESAMEKRQRQSASAWSAPTDTVHDPSGQFLLRRVSAGTHELRARTVDGSSATLVLEVAAGERKQGVRVVLERGARIVGRVVDAETNQPVADVEVRAFAPSMVNRSPARTDGTGAFALEGVSAGENVQVMILGDRKTHLMERRTAEIAKGTPQADLGTIRLMRGNIEARIKEGTWEGLTGISNSEDEKATVTQARPGTPAEKAGIKSGDLILSVDGKDVRGRGYGGVEYELRGKPGTKVTVTVQSPGEAPRTVSFNRMSTEEAQAIIAQQQAARRAAAASAATAAPRPAAP